MRKQAAARKRVPAAARKKITRRRAKAAGLAAKHPQAARKRRVLLPPRKPPARASAAESNYNLRHKSWACAGAADTFERAACDGRAVQERDVAQRHDADKPFVSIDDGQPAHAQFRHGTRGFLHIIGLE